MKQENKTLTMVLVGLIIFVAVSISYIGDYGRSKKQIYTLYRDSNILNSARIHVATFDAVESNEEYNKINCLRARDLFAKQEVLSPVNWWCEKGYFQP